MLSFSQAQIERFKREAKLLHRESSVPHSQALDSIATANGFKNWSLLMKHSDMHGVPKPPTKSARPPQRFSRTAEFMKLALRKVPEPSASMRKTRIEVAQEQVADLSQTFVSAQNAVDFAIDYMTCLLTVPRFKIYAAAPARWEMRSWLPYSCHPCAEGEHILVNREYKPVGQVGKAWANYEEFPHLHARIASEARKRFTAEGSSDGYLFNDSCAPWDSRVDAVAYLERLKILRQMLKGQGSHYLPQ